MTTLDRTEQHNELEAQIKGKICLGCKSEPRIVWLGSLIDEDRYGLRCNCADYLNPRLGKADYWPNDRRGKMVNDALAKRPDQMPLSIEEVRKYISTTATEAEAYIFLRFCKAQGLNPFVGDAYLIKYDPSSKAAIVVGVQARLKRAARNPNYDGFDSGVLVAGEHGEPVRVDGAVVGTNAELLGGWCEVRRHDREKPLYWAVPLSAYDKDRALWRTMKASMISKVAISQAHDKAFPEEEELPIIAEGLDVTVADVEEAQSLEAPTRPALFPEQRVTVGMPRAAEAPERPAEPQKPEGPDVSQSAPAPVAGATHDVDPVDPAKFKNAGDLMLAASQRWPDQRYQNVATALGVKGFEKISDFVDAWHRLEKAWG